MKPSEILTKIDTLNKEIDADLELNLTWADCKKKFSIVEQLQAEFQGYVDSWKMLKATLAAERVEEIEGNVRDTINENPDDYTDDDFHFLACTS